MKKIKRKPLRSELRLPTFVVGYAAPEPLPAGFLSVWFNQEYGGPLNIRFPDAGHPYLFEAHHGPWSAIVDTDLPPSIATPWHERLGWGHTRAGQVVAVPAASRESRDSVLHMARLARGLTILTGGTAHDTQTAMYLNPSDWSDRQLFEFRLSDHLRIEQVTGRSDNKVWFHSRGMAKFGLEDIETFRAEGLSERPVIEGFTEIADALISLGKSPKVGEGFEVQGLNRIVRVTRHRTDQSYHIRLNLREIEWDAPSNAAQW